jgi:hypothetical protein
MADIATTASEKTSNDPGTSDHILERLEALSIQYHEECRPDSEFVYQIQGEEEAAQILLAMAATIKHTAEGVRNKMDHAQYVQIAADYRQAVVQGKALQTFREMTEDDQLEIYGLKLSARRILLS